MLAKSCDHDTCGVARSVCQVVTLLWRRERRVARKHAERLRDILAALEHSSALEGANLPGFRLQALKGPLKGHFAVSVSGSWGVPFRFEESAMVDVDCVDYH